MNHTEQRIDAWELLTRTMMHLISDPYKGHTEEETAEIQRTEYLGKNIVIKACNTLHDCRVKVKAEAFSQMRKDADNLTAELIASDPALLKRHHEVMQTPWAKRLSARK